MTLDIQIPREAYAQPVAEMDRAVALVIDDDPDTRTWMATILRAERWRVYQAPANVWPGRFARAEEHPLGRSTDRGGGRESPG
jgi:hypothetical protein